MDPSLRPTSSNGGISVRNSKLNIILWYFMKTLTMCSMLLMVLSIYYSFIASEDENRGGFPFPSSIIVVFGLISYTFINPNLAQIAAVAIPYVEAIRHISIRMLLIVVWIIGGMKYPFLVYFPCSSLMASVGLLKLYGDGGPTYKRVMEVIVLDVLQPCGYTFKNHKEIHGTGWAQCGPGLAMCGLSIMGYIAYRLLPQLMDPMEPERERVESWMGGTKKFLEAGAILEVYSSSS